MRTPSQSRWRQPADHPRQEVTSLAPGALKVAVRLVICPSHLLAEMGRDGPSRNPYRDG